jgi:hypothetical protein
MSSGEIGWRGKDWANACRTMLDTAFIKCLQTIQKKKQNKQKRKKVVLLREKKRRKKKGEI